jgi:antitoxin YefM
MIMGLIPCSARGVGTPGTWETYVVWLITQRSRVQISPLLPRPEAGSRTENRPLACLMLTNLAHGSRRGSPLTLSGFLVILLTMTVLPLGDVKSHLSELVGRVHDHHERVTVTVHGRPSAILIAPEDLEALEETLEIMRDAATMNRLAESDAELARGEYVSAEELAEAMRRRRAQ